MVPKTITLYNGMVMSYRKENREVISRVFD